MPNFSRTEAHKGIIGERMLMLFKREREACEAIFDEPGDYERQLE
ncbi:MAG: hypothetical protein OXI01_21650 [Albidovulum sp.]|nr:hypothetical protein [Albidovulum sp.]